MLAQVFFDLRYFLLLFSIFVYAFSLLLGVLVGGYDADYDGLGSSMALFFIALRTSLGDNEIADYQRAYDNQKSLAWMAWLMTIVVGNVVFMNFIIAVVQQSYENCMTKMVAQGYKVKVEMIIEREAQMKDEDFKNP